MESKMIKLFITTALTYEGHHKYGDKALIEKRNKQYCEFIHYMNQYDISKYYCECVDRGPNTFLNPLISNIFYSGTHDPRIKNHGVDEINAWKAAITHFNFSDDDIIIKLTGRYFPNSSYFFDAIINNETLYDVFCHAFPPWHTGYGQVFVGAFAMRGKLLKQYIENVNVEKLERDMTNIEFDIYTFIKQYTRVKYLDRLDITVHSGNGKDVWQV